MSLIIAGLGVKFLSHLTMETEKVIQKSEKVLYLTNDDAYPKYLKTLNKNSESLNEIYFSVKNRERSYQKIKEKILQDLNTYKNVCVLVYGHPTFLVQSTQQVVKIAEENGYKVKILPGISSLDCLFADLRINPGDGGLQVLEATEMLAYKKIIDTSSHLIIFQIAAIGLKGHENNEECYKKRLSLLSQFLKNYYNHEYEIILYEASQYPNIPPKITQCRLSDLDKKNISALTTMYIPPLRKAEKNLEIIEKIKTIFC